MHSKTRFYLLVTAQSNAFSSLFLRNNSDSSSLLHHLFLEFISDKVNTRIKFCYLFFCCDSPFNPAAAAAAAEAAAASYFHYFYSGPDHVLSVENIPLSIHGFQLKIVFRINIVLLNVIYFVFSTPLSVNHCYIVCKLKMILILFRCVQKGIYVSFRNVWNRGLD
jgi:hypothetical protein